jgi:hypothetical protein
MESLSDRYVWAVVRRLPHGRRAAVAASLRAELADAIAAESAPGVDSEAAEKAVITRWGDPDRRAAELAGSPAYLIGPARFFDYRRLVTIVLSAVAPSVFGALLLALLLSGTGAWQAVGTALSIAFTVTVQVAFWLTVAFAIAERVSRGRPTPSEWDVSDLPDIPTSRVGIGETIVAVLAYLLFVGLVLWQRNIWVVESAGGPAIPLLDERLWEFWIPWFIGVAVAELVFAVGAFLIGRWTWIVALVNALLALAFAVPAVVLLWSEDVVSPQFRSTFEGLGPLVDGLLAFAPFIVIAVALLDIIGGVRRVLAARRTA